MSSPTTRVWIFVGNPQVFWHSWWLRLGTPVVELDLVACKPRGVKWTLAERWAGVHEIGARPGFITEGIYP
jgi:hypothetical protein